MDFGPFAQYVGQGVLILSDDLDGLEIIVLAHVVIGGGQGHGFIQQFGHSVGRSLSVAPPGKAEHVVYNCRDSPPRFVDRGQHARNVAALHKGADGVHGDAGRRGLFQVGRDTAAALAGQAIAHHLGGLHHARQGIVDFVRHARGQPAHGEHFLRLDEQLFHPHALGYVVYADGDTFHAVGRGGVSGDERVDGHVRVNSFFVCAVCSLGIALHFAALHGLASPHFGC